MPAPRRPTLSSELIDRSPTADRDARRLRVEVGAEERVDHQVLASGVGDLVVAGRGAMGDHQLVAPGLAAADLQAGVPSPACPDEDAVDAGLAQPVHAAGRDDDALAGVLVGVVEDPGL